MAVWGGYVNLFIHLNNRRIQENKERDTKLQKALREIKNLKKEIAAFEQQNRDRKVRQEMKMKNKIRERNIMLKLTTKHRRHDHAAKSIQQIATEDIDAEDISEDDSDVENPLDYIQRTMQLNKKVDGSGVDRKLRKMLKDLNEQRRNDFEVHDWAEAMIADSLFEENPELRGVNNNHAEDE